MSVEEFNALLNGPLNHQLMPFQITRLTMALMHVVMETGEQGAKALREFCNSREEIDDFMSDLEG
jgi:methylaspartate ammonia-lyase